MMAETAHSGGPGRNDPCPCGSGRRYKECCGRLHQGEPHAAVMPLMDAALEAQRGRDLRRAAEIYRSTSSANWRIAIADSVGGAALTGLGRLDDAEKRLDQGLSVLRGKDSGAPAIYVQIAEQYSRDLQQHRAHAPRTVVASKTSAS